MARSIRIQTIDIETIICEVIIGLIGYWSINHGEGVKAVVICYGVSIE